jgi:hypothetical protein
MLVSAMTVADIMNIWIKINLGRTVKVFESKQERSRRRGRPRLRWLEDVKKDLLEKNVKRWRQKAVDREEWASVMEAKAPKGTAESKSK